MVSFRTTTSLLLAVFSSLTLGYSFQMTTRRTLVRRRLRPQSSPCIIQSKLFLSDSSAAAATPNDDDDDDKSKLQSDIESKLSMEEKVDDDTTIKIESSADDTKLTFVEHVKTYFNPPDDGLTFRQRLRKLGLAAVLSYGWVSNMSYSVTVSIAWYLFSKQTGKSPLAPGQWKGFLAVYAGFWVFNNIVRPIRLAISVAIAPQFDRIVARIQTKMNVSKPVAITITVILANLVGTTVCMCSGIALAAALAGVPVFATKV